MAVNYKINFLHLWQHWGGGGGEDYLSKAAVKHIERTVILRVPHILGKVLHFHLYRVTLIILSTLKLLVAIFLGQSLEKQKRENPKLCIDIAFRV